MDVIVIDSEVWHKLNQQLIDIQSQLKQIQSSKPTTKPSGDDKTITEIKNYVPLAEAYQLLNINKQKWYRTYQHIIQHKTYYNNTWVYLPSILKFLKENNLNENEE